MTEDQSNQTQQLQSFQEQLKQQAGTQAASAASDFPEAISALGGQYKLNDQLIGDNGKSFQAFVLAYAWEYTYYPNQFNPDKKEMPACWSVGPFQPDPQLAPIPDKCQDQQSCSTEEEMFGILGAYYVID